MSIRGLFVSIDGPGGAGKSSTAALVCDQLARRGLPVCATAEPSSTPLGKMIRASTDIYRGMALACLVAGDRHHHLATEIRPQRQRGAIVICDRYLPSSLVLQRMDGVAWDTIWQLNSGAQSPDLAVILNAHQRSSPGGWPTAAAPTAASSVGQTARPPKQLSTRTPPPGLPPLAGPSAASTQPTGRPATSRL